MSMTVDQESWRAKNGEKLIRAGKSIVQVEDELARQGFLAYVPIQERYISLAASEGEISEFESFKGERAAEILSSFKYFGSHLEPGDGYESPLLNRLRADGVSSSAMLLSKWDQLFKQDPYEFRNRVDASIAQCRARVDVESSRFEGGASGTFEIYADVLSAVRRTARSNGAVFSNLTSRPKDGDVVFSLSAGNSSSFAFTLVRPSSSYSEAVSLSWRIFLVKDAAETSSRLKSLVPNEDYAIPIEIGFAIIGFNVYHSCRSMAMIENNVSAYIAAIGLISQKLLG